MTYQWKITQKPKASAHSRRPVRVGYLSKHTPGDCCRSAATIRPKGLLTLETLEDFTRS